MSTIYLFTEDIETIRAISKNVHFFFAQRMGREENMEAFNAVDSSLANLSKGENAVSVAQLAEWVEIFTAWSTYGWEDREARFMRERIEDALESIAA